MVQIKNPHLEDHIAIEGDDRRGIGGDHVGELLTEITRVQGVLYCRNEGGTYFTTGKIFPI